ncbi:MAG: diaminopimelate decarboxylase [Candidatus Eremiobacteraeota bacterium]|nr:diaminopimelate decarboxylase [Candidatus Eremiobacteraeota bacterium]
MLTVGGMRADILAERYGTPALLLDLAVFDGSLSALVDAASAHGIRVSYAAKALLLTALAKRLQTRDVGLDVASLGELITAERGGIEAPRITLHGAGKTDEEIDAAFVGRVGRLVIDSVDELHRVVEISRGRSLDVLLRMNTGIEAHTHEFIRTAGDDTKFGLAPRDEDAVLAMLRANSQLRLRGVHAHIGSQIFDARPYAANAQALLEKLDRYRRAGFAGADTMVIGGGFGVQMHPESPDETIDVPAILAAVAAAVPHGVTVEIEPGRATVAAAGTSLYRVMAIKRYAKRTFAVVDGSMADNPRPALYGAYHHVVAARKSDAPYHPVTVCGRSCENDALADAPLPQDLRAGDLLAFCTTGAYTYSMASNYNRFPRPPVVAIENREATLWARRESIEDVFRNDV